MTTKERLDELEKRVLNLEIKLQTKLVKKNDSLRKSPPKNKSKSK